ncbi:MAG: PEP-CTERM sorting domain-containing protein [Planctomycetaceae bacterium]|nr:PEP-CTERM sorting domain-containing protein [Planctomycetaceae bacterium]
MRRKIILCLCGVVILSCSISASAAQWQPWYDIQHNFILRPGGSIVPKVIWYEFEHTWAVDNASPAPYDFDVNPLAQPANFARFGTDRGKRNGDVINSGGAKVNKDTFNVPQGGGVGSGSITSNDPGSTGRANSSVTVNPFVAGGNVTGNVHVWGDATANGTGSERGAYGFSYSGVTAQGGRALKNGRIAWNPVFRAAVSGSAGGATWGTDPINITVHDLVTDETLIETLLFIECELNGMNDEIDWSNGMLSLDATDAVFHIDISSQYTVQRGYLDLAVENGVITTSSDGGIFDGILPSIGGSGTFDVALSSEMILDYDMGEFDGHDLDVTLDWCGTGAAIVPEPATIMMLSTGGFAFVRKRRA